MSKHSGLAYALSVSLGKGRYVTLVSNREMTPEAWAKLDRYIELQRDIWADDASGMPLREDPQGLRPKAGSPARDSGDAQNMGGE